jgi:membrane protein implicated in regulation of membrane protease activity
MASACPVGIHSSAAGGNPMTVFLIVGTIGIAVVLLALVLGDILDAAFDSLGDLFSAEALGVFLGALGFVGAIVLSLTGSVPLSLAVGAACGLALGASAWWGSRRLRAGDHSGTVRTTDLIERTATVVAELPADGLGVVSLSVGGHLTRVNARSDVAIPGGTEVVVVAVLSPTLVRVVPLFES